MMGTMRGGPLRVRRFATSIGMWSAVCALLVFSPAVATGPSSLLNRTITAPYHGFAVTFDSHGVVGCGAARVVTPAFFHFARGVGGFSDRAKASSCAGNSSSSGSASAVLETYVKTPYHAGSPTIFANLTLNITGHYLLNSGTCTLLGTPKLADCVQFSAYYVYGYSYLIDNTTGNRSYPSSAWSGSLNFSENVTTCKSGVCISNLQGSATSSCCSTNLSFRFHPGKMVKTDKYLLLLYLYGGAQVVLSTHSMRISGASGSASLNFAALGNGVTLTSIVET
jgi:hypothetical protein